MSLLKYLIPKRRSAQLFMLFFTWATIQVIAYVHFEIRLAVDSEMYIENASMILNGKLPLGRDFLYITYSLVLAGFELLNIDPRGVIFLQIVLAGIALYLLYRLVFNISQETTSPFITCFLYVIWFKFQQWNLIVYTESLFVSMIIVSAYYLQKATRLKEFLWVFVPILITCLLRPTGLWLLVAAFFFIFYRLQEYYNWRLRTKFILWCTLLFGSILLTNLYLESFIASIISSYQQSEIIYPGISLFFEKPIHFQIPSEKVSPLTRLLIVIKENFFHILKISSIKGLMFLAHMKPYYSPLHNMLIGLILYPVYFFAIKGFIASEHSAFKSFGMIFIVLQVITISLTSLNWDGRFLLPLLPFFFIYGGIGIRKAAFAI